jgi:guanylate kinase
MILTFTGASGAGKTTLAKAIIRLLPNASLSPGCTTRTIRPGEASDEIHHLSIDKFSEMREREEFLWAVQVHGHWYGTLKRVVAEGLALRERCLILVLTPDVLPILRCFAKECGHHNRVFSVYVVSPEPCEIRSRLVAREIDVDIIERRIIDCLDWDRAACSSSLYDLHVSGEGDVEKSARQVLDKLARIQSD